MEKPVKSFLEAWKETADHRSLLSRIHGFGHIHIVEKLDGERVTRADGKMIITVKEPAIAEEINIALVGAGCRVRKYQRDHADPGRRIPQGHGRR